MRLNMFFILAFVLVPPAFMIFLGTINIFKKDWSWRLTDWVLRDVKPQRTPEWEQGLTLNGVILILAGLAILIYVLLQAPRLLYP